MTASRCCRIGAAACALFLFSLSAAAAVNLRIEDVAGNPGESVEAGLFLTLSNEDAPTVLILFIAYDPAYLAPATTFYGGTSPVKLATALTQAGFTSDAQVYDQGVLAIAILGTGANTLPPSSTVPMLNIAFDIKPTAPVNISVLLNGLAPDEPVEINGVFSASSAANAASSSLTVNFTDGAVVVGCVPRAEAPANVTATQDRPDGVLVAWPAVAGAGAEYRVYRSTTAAFVTAEPVGNAWSQQTSFLDTTAAAPATPGNAGCACPAPEPVITTYYYWVVARTAAGCTGDPSATPAQGSRSAAKFAPEAATTQANALPAERNADGLRLAPADAPLAVRLTAAEALRPESIVGSLAGVDLADFTLEQLPGAGPQDVWLRATPVASWPEDRPLYFAARGETLSGAAVGVVAGFIASAAGSEKAVGLEALEPADLPFLEGGLNAPYRLQPEGVYDAPQTVRIPVPAGERPEDLRVYYFDGADGAATWHDAQAVAGWLAGAPVVDAQGAYIVIEARHSGIFQLGLRDTTPKTSAAAMPPFGWTPGLRGDALLVGGLFLAGLVATARYRHRAQRA